jgi:phosphoglycolate phosphatase
VTEQSGRASRPVVAFDLDGTLVDTMADITTALNGALADVAAGRPLRTFAGEEARAFIGHGATELVVGAQRHLGWDMGPDEVESAVARFRHHYEVCCDDESAPFDGMLEVVDELLAAGVGVAVATNKPGAFARRVIAATFPGRFDVVVGPDDVGVHKPDPTMLHVAAERTGGPLLAYVGDSHVDVEAAQRAVSPCVAVTWGFGAEERLTGEHVRRVSDAGQLSEALFALLEGAGGFSDGGGPV